MLEIYEYLFIQKFIYGNNWHKVSTIKCNLGQRAIRKNLFNLYIQGYVDKMEFYSNFGTVEKKVTYYSAIDLKTKFKIYNELKEA